jgi:hypothetical protein
MVERFLDGTASEAELRAAQHAFVVAHHRSHQRLGRDDPLEPIRFIFPQRTALYSGDSGLAALSSTPKAARFAIRKKQRGAEYPAQAALIRDVLGNPFHHVNLNPTLRTPVVLALAQAAYDNRIMPAGTLDPERLAVLADALEESGCTDADILGHLRGPGPHVRGCHILDLVLDKK